MLPGGSLYCEIGRAGFVLATSTNCIAMAREVLVSFVLVGANSKCRGDAFNGRPRFM